MSKKKNTGLPPPTTRAEWEFQNKIKELALDLERRFVRLRAANRRPRTLGRDQDFWVSVAQLCLKEAIEPPYLLEALVQVAAGNLFQNLLKSNKVIEAAKQIPILRKARAQDSLVRDLQVYKDLRELGQPASVILAADLYGFTPIFKYSISRMTLGEHLEELQTQAGRFLSAHPEYEYALQNSPFAEVLSDLRVDRPTEESADDSSAEGSDSYCQGEDS